MKLIVILLGLISVSFWIAVIVIGSKAILENNQTLGGLTIFYGLVALFICGAAAIAFEFIDNCK